MMKHIPAAAELNTAKAFDGKMEEIVVYKQAIYPVSTKEEKYIFKKEYSELQEGQSFASPQNRYVKLFAKDYHNIRGRTTVDVAASQTLTIKKASFALDTTP